MIFNVENFLKKYDLLKSEKTFLVGFSGGADSFCLLDIMFQLSRKYQFKVIALHLNHNWRGEESLLEQKRCEKIAKDYSFEFITETLEKSVKISENSARIYRYKFFEKYANIHNAVVLTAHNSCDNVETLLYRIAKGTGISGLVGIPEFIEKNKVQFYRPLLDVSREDIEIYCKNKNLIPNCDSSNNSLKYKRNFIRQKIIPQILEINPKAIKSINSLSNLARENEFIINELLCEYFENGNIIFPKFKKASFPLRSKVIHKFFVDKRLEYDRKKILEVLEFLENPKNVRKKYSLTTDLWLSFNGSEIFCVEKNKKDLREIEIKDYGNYVTPFGGKFEVKKCSEVKSYPKETDFNAVVDISNVGFPFVLRTRRDGDIIQPFGMKGKMKLKKYLISKKIPQEKRDKLLLLARDNEVFWVIGVGLSDKLKVAKVPSSVFKYIV